jgi:hypothetical protein
MTCTHMTTQGRQGERGSWCCACGIKVYAVDERTCDGCAHAQHLIGGWICNRHLMTIVPNMHVTYRISEGSCWTGRTE